MKLLLANVPCMLCAVCAAAIAASGHNGWGWFIFLSALFFMSPSKD